MFNEDSMIPEKVAGGTEVEAINNPQIGVNQTSAAEAQARSEDAVAQSGVTALAWWDDMKFYWKRNKAGNGFHLAPQDTYVDDVLHRADYYMTSVAKHELGDDDFKEFEEAAQEWASIVERENGRDTSGIEGQAVLRDRLNRLVIARKVCGVNAVSAEHRVEHENSLPNGNVQAMKDDPKGYYQSDVDKRQSWAHKACRLEYIVKQLADGDVIPKDPAQFSALLAQRISKSIYDDAVQKGNQLKNPTPAKQESRQLTLEEKLALTA